MIHNFFRLQLLGIGNGQIVNTTCPRVPLAGNCTINLLNYVFGRQVCIESNLQPVIKSVNNVLANLLSMSTNLTSLNGIFSKYKPIFTANIKGFSTLYSTFNSLLSAFANANNTVRLTKKIGNKLYILLLREIILNS